MSSAISVQLHQWPWSFGIREETQDLQDGGVHIRYMGSPVLSVSEDCSVFLGGRYEKFIPYGAAFTSLSGRVRLFQVPHAVVTRREEDAEEYSSGAPGELFIQGPAGSRRIYLRARGALPAYVDTDGRREDSGLKRMVRIWANVFDECRDRTDQVRSNEFPWAGFLDFISGLALHDEEPRMALIVFIAGEMRQQLPVIVHGARRLLVRERKLIPAGQISEWDSSCLHWYIRQPGENIAEKASSHRQCLMGIARRETLDTLENKVLKDFLRRCGLECYRYLRFDCSDRQRSSNRGRQIRSFQTLCESLYADPAMSGISLPSGTIRPNYVLQNDSRYKRLWKLYLRLRRQEEEKDRLWAWQGRTWADIAGGLLHAALISLTTSSGCFSVRPLAGSSLVVLREQRLGCRLAAGSEPGPFLVSTRNTSPERRAVLEIVHSDQAAGHPLTVGLGRLGAWLYFILSPLSDAGARKKVIAVWPVHTAASEYRIPEDAIRDSAEQALYCHYRALSERDSSCPVFRGLVLCSSFEDSDAFSAGDTVHLAPLCADPAKWNKNIEKLTLLLEDILERTL